MKTKRLLVALVPIFSLLLTGCGSSSNSSDSSSSNTLDNLTNFFSDSANVSLVKDGYVQACPNATLGEMADAFMSAPNWREFTSVTGGTVVELTGQISYSGLPTDATIQFTVTGKTLEAAYLGIGREDQSLLVLSALLNKMCEATL